MSAFRLVHWLAAKLPTNSNRLGDEAPRGHAGGVPVDSEDNAAIRALQETVASAARSTQGGAANPSGSSPIPLTAASDQVGDYAAAGERPADQIEFIDHFEIRRVLGRGGFGAVYLAHDKKLDRMVALKLLDKLDKKAAREMLIHETRAASKLKHPNLVNVFQTGEHVRGCYIVFEYIPGPERQKARTLREAIRIKQRIPPREAVAILRQISLALAYAHESDVVHRDIKPENILIDYKGTAYLADFGCARRGRRHAPALKTLVGTLPYMSLEQLHGQGSVQTDIWSTGIVLYEMLSGNRPFASAEKVRSHTAAEAAYSFAAAILATERLSPIPGIDADLEAICTKCLRKSPDERYASAAALATDLGRWQRNEPVSCRPVGVVERARRWTQRNPVIAAQLAAIALILLAGFLVSAYFAVNMWKARQLYVTEQITYLDQIDSATFAAAVTNLQHETFRALSVKSLASQWQTSLDDPRRAELLPRLAAAIVAFDRAPITTKPDTELVRAARAHLLAALLTARTPAEFLFLRTYAAATGDQRTTDDGAQIRSLWKIAANTEDPDERFRALAALSDYGHDDERWNDFALTLAKGLLDQDDQYVAGWTNTVSAVGARLVPLLKTDLASANETQKTRATIAYSILASTRGELLNRVLAEQSPAAVYELLVQIKSRFGSSPDVVTQLRQLAAETNETTARELVNLTVAELFLRGSAVGDRLPIFARQVDMEARYLFEKYAADYGLTLTSLFDWLRVLQSESAAAESLQTALLAMGHYDLGNLPENTRQLIREEVVSIFKFQEAASVHSAAAWALTQWKVGPPNIDKPNHTAGDNSWRINQLGQMLVRVSLPAGRTCEVTVAEITLGDYARYVQSRAAYYSQDRRVLSWIGAPVTRHMHENSAFPDHDADDETTGREYDVPRAQQRLPMRYVSALQAVAYCVWASDRDGIAEDQMCFQLARWPAGRRHVLAGGGRTAAGGNIESAKDVRQKRLRLSVTLFRRMGAAVSSRPSRGLSSGRFTK